MSRNLTSALVDELRARTVDGRISPAERLPGESTLIAEHGVTRTVVHEASAPAATARDEHRLARTEDAPARSEEEAGNPAASAENDVEFHRTVAQAGGSGPSAAAPENG